MAVGAVLVGFKLSLHPSIGNERRTTENVRVRAAMTRARDDQTRADVAQTDDVR